MSNLPWVARGEGGIDPPLHIAVEFKLSPDGVPIRGTTGTVTYGVYEHRTRWMTPVFVADVGGPNSIHASKYVYAWRCVREIDARACGLLS